MEYIYSTLLQTSFFPLTFELLLIHHRILIIPIYFQALIQQKADVYLFSDKMEAANIRKTLLNPVEDIGVLVDSFIEEIGPDARICILPEGPQTIPYLKA